MARTALIVGAGIGGLSAAISLRKAGWNVRVFERAASVRELGFALLVAPNAMAALRELGVADVVLARGVVPTRGEARRMDGTVLKRADFPSPEVMGGPTVVALRPAVHGALLEAVGEEAVTLDCEATGFSMAGDRVTLRTADGDIAEGDLLVGADGTGSAIRRALHPSEPPPRSCGLIAVRAAAHGAVDHLDGLSGIHYMGRGVESFLARASDTGIYWGLGLAQELLPAGIRDDPAAILRHVSPRFDETFRAATSGTTDMRVDELVDRDPLPFFRRGDRGAMLQRQDREIRASRTGRPEDNSAASHCRAGASAPPNRAPRPPSPARRSRPLPVHTTPPGRHVDGGGLFSLGGFLRMKRTALIVGAGIGGLSAGIALRQAGWEVRLFERAASARELGFGLGMAPNAIAALRRLGVADAVLARGFRPTRGELRRMDGTVLKRAELPSSEAALGGPMVVTVRSALYGALLDALGPDAITFGSEVTGFVADGDRVAIHTGSGETAEGDLLIGADGVGSAIRRALHPSEPPPRACGIVAVRGASDAGHHLGDLSAIMYLGRGLESVLVRASDTGVYWYLSLAREIVPSDTRDPAAIVAHMSPRMDATLRAVASDTDELRCDELVDRDPLPRWGDGVVTLLGDAAHPLLPHTGQGAAQAIVDAVTLGQALGEGANVADALRAYERERLPKTAVLVAQGRRTARVMRTRNPVACSIREVAIRLAPVELFLKLYVRINRRAGTDVTQAA